MTAGGGAWATAELWRRLPRPLDAAAALRALLGVEPDRADQVVAASLLASAEAARLIATMPTLVRSLSTAVVAHPERCPGEVRGPILWGETNAARAAGGGPDDLFVCAVNRRVLDTAENRLLVACLEALVRAGRLLAGGHPEGGPTEPYPAREVAGAAARWLAGPALAEIARGRIGSREVRRVRTGQRRSRYEPVLAFHDRRREPVDAPAVVALVDVRRAAEHVEVLRLLDAGGAGPGPALVVRDGELWAGRLRYRPGRAPALLG